MCPYRRTRRWSHCSMKFLVSGEDLPANGQKCLLPCLSLKSQMVHDPIHIPQRLHVLGTLRNQEAHCLMRLAEVSRV